MPVRTLIVAAAGSHPIRAVERRAGDELGASRHRCGSYALRTVAGRCQAKCLAWAFDALVLEVVATLVLAVKVSSSKGVANMGKMLQVPCRCALTAGITTQRQPTKKQRTRGSGNRYPDGCLPAPATFVSADERAAPPTRAPRGEQTKHVGPESAGTPTAPICSVTKCLAWSPAFGRVRTHRAEQRCRASGRVCAR